MISELPGLHAGEGVLDPGPDLLVGPVVLFLPVRELGLAALATVRDDQPGARVAAVCDHKGLAEGGPGTGLLPGPAVVAVPGERSTDHDDAPGVGVDDDLVVGGVPIVLDCSATVWSRVGTRVPSTISTVSLRNRFASACGPRSDLIPGLDHPVGPPPH